MRGIGTRKGPCFVTARAESVLDRFRQSKFFGYPAFALAADFREEMQTGHDGLKVVGYGRTESGDLGTRMKTSVPILTPDCLVSQFRPFCAPFQEMVMADRPAARVPRDTCGGDSGGPVFVHAK